jgi:voltage-gated sodium channel
MLGRPLQLWMRLQELNEPPRSGWFADFVQGNVFEMAICVLILVNVLFMVYSTNVEVLNPGEFNASLQICKVIFQVLYTVEMIMKLVVHRQWYFFYGFNVFDFVLVVTGLIGLAFGSNSAGFLRVLRLAKFGKAIRALRAMTFLKHLRALMVCLVGSVASLFWSLVTLFLVYALFSILFMQMILMHLDESGETLEEAGFDELFGSVEKSILTLYMASTGGDDWSVAYHVIKPTGVLAQSSYLFFIAFVQFALINIITGIFVESAMMTLSPDDMVLAQEHTLKEKENAKMLVELCQRVDHDQSGKLTQDQFEDGLRKKQIPMLLTMLGLQRHHVLELFHTMAEAADDDGQVEIRRFVEGCMLLKGAATNFDIQKLQAEFRMTQLKHEESMAEIVTLLQDFGSSNRSI